MKFTNYNDLSDPASYIFAPDVTHVSISPKMNGVACRISVDPGTGRAIFMTKNGKRWNPEFFDSILDRHGLERHLQKSHIRVVNAELCLLPFVGIPDVPLATFAGWVSVNSERPAPEAESRLVFSLYDCQTLDRLTYFARMERLAGELYQNQFCWPTHYCLHEVYNMAELEQAHNSFSFISPEGSVIRLDPQYYMSDDNPATDPRTIKWKRYHEEEGEILVAYEGRGKRRGMLGSFCVRTPTGKQIHVGGGAGVDDATLARWWNNPPIGKMLTYRYDELSVNGKPLRAQIVAIRDYE